MTIKGAKGGASITEFVNTWFNIGVVFFDPPKAYKKETEDWRHIQKGNWKSKTRYRGKK